MKGAHLWKRVLNEGIRDDEVIVEGSAESVQKAIICAKIIVGPPMQHPTMPMHGSINKPVVRAAVLGLHMDDIGSNSYVAVMAKQHSWNLSPPEKQTNNSPRISFPSDLTERLLLDIIPLRL